MYVTTVPVIDRLIAERRLRDEGGVPEVVRDWARTVRSEARELNDMLEVFDDDNLDYGSVHTLVGRILDAVDSCPVPL